MLNIYEDNKNNINNILLSLIYLFVVYLAISPIITAMITGNIYK